MTTSATFTPPNKLGLDARRVQLEERQVDQIERVITAALGLLGVQAEQREVRAAVHEAVRTIEGQSA